MRSCAVRNDQLAARNLPEMLFHLGGGDAERARNLLVRGVPSRRRAVIEERHGLTRVEPRLDLLGGHRCRFHGAVLELFNTNSPGVGATRFYSDQICNSRASVGASTGFHLATLPVSLPGEELVSA